MRHSLILAGIAASLLGACGSESPNGAEDNGSTGGAASDSLGSVATGGADASGSSLSGGTSALGGAGVTGGVGGSAPAPSSGGLGGSGGADISRASSGGSTVSGAGGTVTGRAGASSGSASGGLETGGVPPDAAGGAGPSLASGGGGPAETGGTLSDGGASATGGVGPSSGGSLGVGDTGGTSQNTGGVVEAGGGVGPGGSGGSGAVPADTGGSDASGSTGGSTSAGGSGGSTGGEIGCDRGGLQAAVDAYLAAVEAGDTALMPLAASAAYSENLQRATLGQGIWQTALPVSFSRSFLDVTECQTFTEVFVTEGASPHVIGTRLVIDGGNIAEIESIITGDGDWNFDATAYQTCSESEAWEPLPEAEQSSREELIAAGEAYFAVFSDPTTTVPWGSPCYRLEGGAGCTPTMDSMSQSCNVGIPEGITFSGTHWVVDVEMNTAVGITKFGGGLPDTHMFRLIDGKIRYIHTLTVM